MEYIPGHILRLPATCGSISHLSPMATGLKRADVSRRQSWRLHWLIYAAAGCVGDDQRPSRRFPIDYILLKDGNHTQTAFKNPEI